MGVGVAEDPASAVDEEDDRQRAGGPGGLDDAHLHVAHLGRDGDPLVVDVGLGYGGCLDVIEGLAGFIRGELIEERRLRGLVGHRLRCGLENELVHVNPFCWIRHDAAVVQGR